MRTRFRNDEDGWAADGANIASHEALETIRRCLEDEGPIIAEHRFYRGAAAPEWVVFDQFERFHDYLETHAFAGDSIHVWSLTRMCSDANALASGKCPDDDGLVPTRGAY